jgi:release factor glutamine methyltransferase
MLIKDVLIKTTEFFRSKGFDSPRLDSELLIASAMNWERMKLYLNYEYVLNETELTSCREFVRRRSSGEPVAYILGYKDFYKHRFAVTSDVLIPRPETEMLVEQTVAWLAQQDGEGRLRVIDLGTGSGCVGLSIAAENSKVHCLCVENSPGALAVAELNAKNVAKILPHAASQTDTQEEFTKRLHFLNADASLITVKQIEETLGARADAVVANPPYIAIDDPDVQTNVRKFEPEHALFAAGDGLDAIRAWSKSAALVLRPGGFVMFEIGHQQGESAKKIFADREVFEKIEIVHDLAGHERFLKCLKIEGN